MCFLILFGGRLFSLFCHFHLPFLFWQADCCQDLTLSVCHSFLGRPTRRLIWRLPSATLFLTGRLSPGFDSFRLPLFLGRPTRRLIWRLPSATLFLTGRLSPGFDSFRLPLFLGRPTKRLIWRFPSADYFPGGRRDAWFEDFRLPTIFRAADGTLVHKASIRSESGVPKR